jgi:AmmeMemoRadiSam system protein A
VIPELGPLERAALLGIARAALRHRLAGGPAPELPQDGPLAGPRGAFVTLRRSGELRGCIGAIAAREPLARAVARLAVAAAIEDPRFPPVSEDELGDLTISISVLGAPRRLEDPSALQIGRDGATVQLGWHRGVLLPCVAVEHGWDAEELLRHTCLKAGLWPDAWKEPGATVEIFSAQEFAE